MENKQPKMAPPANTPRVLPGFADSTDLNGTSGGYGLPVNQSYTPDPLRVHVQGEDLAEKVPQATPPAKVFSLSGSVSHRRSLVVSALITLIVVAITASSMLFFTRKAVDKLGLPNSQIKTQDLALQGADLEDLPQEFQGPERSLLVNGDIITKGDLKISNGQFITVLTLQNQNANHTFTLPDDSGTLCLNTNNCNFATNGQLQQLQNQLGQVVSPNIPAASLVNNQQGSVTIQGTSNRINVITNNGVIQLSTPQDLATGSSPSFANLLLTGTLTTTLNCTGFGNGGVLTTNGSGQVICDNDDGGAGSPISGSGTVNRLPLFTAGTTLGDSWLLQSGSTLQLDNSRNLTLLGGDLTLDNATGEVRILESTGGVFYGIIDVSDLSADQTYTFPDASGTICLTSGNCVGVGGTGDILNNGQNGPITVGTNNASSLTLETNNTPRLTISSSGTVTINGLNSTGVVHTNGSGDLSTGDVVLGSETSGGYVANLGSLTGLSTTGNSGEGATPTLAVLYGSSANTAVQGNTVLNCATVSGNLTGGGGAITLGSGGSCNAIGLTATPTFTTVDATTFTGALVGNASTATALAANPTDCSANQFANAIAANGNLTCAALTDGDIPNSITIDLATAATALAANPSDCAANQFANAIAANGNLTCAGIVDADVSDTLTASIFIGSGSTTNAIDLATAEIAGVLADGNVSDTLTIGTSSTVADGALSPNVSLLGQTIDGIEITNGSVANVDLTNSSLTVTAGSGLINGGSVSLGASTTLNIGAGNGIAVNADDITLSLQASKGLEVDSNGLSLIDCSSGEILKYNGSNQWACAADVGASGLVSSLNSLTGALTIQGTANEIQITDNGSNTITVGLPDDVTIGDDLTITDEVTVTGQANLNGPVVVAAQQTLRLVGGTTAQRPGSPTEGMVYFDTDTDQLLVYGGGAWQPMSRSSTKVVAASNSQTPAGADYQVTSAEEAAGNADSKIQAAINALPAGGGTVYLMEGTYTINTGITLPSNVTIAGAGVSTIIKIENAHNADINALSNSGDRNIVIRDLALDGNGSNQSSGFQNAVAGDGFGGGSGATAFTGITIDNILAHDFTFGDGVYFDYTANAKMNSVIRNSRFVGNTIAIEAGADPSNITVEGNYFGGNFNSISFFDGGTGIVINNNVVEESNSDAIAGNRLDKSIISNNIIRNNDERGIRLNGLGLAGVGGNIVSNNTLHNNGGSSGNDGIYITNSSDNNSITGNRITDTAGTSHAINIVDSTVDNTYLADNTYSGTGASTINNAGTGTIFGGQLNGNNYVIDPSGTIELQSNTNVIGNLDASGTLNIGSSNQFSVSSGGALTFNGVATDITTASNEDLTVVANGTGQIILSDLVQVATLGSADTGTHLCRNTLNQIATCTAGGGGGVTDLNGLDGALTIQGTANEVEITDNGSNTITVGLPNDVTIGSDLIVTDTLNINGANVALSVANSAEITGILALGSDGNALNPGQLLTTDTFLTTLEIAQTVTDLTASDYVTGSMMQLLLDPSAPPIATVYADFISVATEATNINDFDGILGSVSSAEHRGSGNVSFLGGYASQAGNSGSGTVSQAIGGQFFVTNSDTGEIATAAGVFSYVQNAAGGTLGGGVSFAGTVENSGAATSLGGTSIAVANTSGGTAELIKGQHIEVSNTGDITVDTNGDSVIGSDITVSNSGNVNVVDPADILGSRLRVENSGTVGNGFGGLGGSLIEVSNTGLADLGSLAGLGINLSNENATVNAAIGLVVGNSTSTSGIINNSTGIAIFGQTGGTTRNVGVEIGETSGAATNINLLLGSSTGSTGSSWSLFNGSTDANLFKGQLMFDGVATDLTTDTNEDLTVVAAGTGIINLNDTTSVGGNLTVAGNILPGTTNTYTLGSDSARWQDIFLGPSSLHIGTNTSDEAVLSYNTSTDSLIAKNAANSTAAFQIQNAASQSLFTADTTNMIIKPGVVASYTNQSITHTQITNGNNQGTPFNSIAIGTDNLPIIAYNDETTNNLVIAHCTVADCSSQTITQVSTGDNDGEYPSIAIGSDGLPVILHYNVTQTDPSVTHCSNITCTSSTTTVITDTDTAGTNGSIAIGIDGLPILAYRNVTDTDLTLTKCANVTCSSVTATTQLTNADNVGFDTSLKIGSDGLPIVAYDNDTDLDAMVTKCTNQSCTTQSTNTIVTPDDDGTWTELLIGKNGRPIVISKDETQTPISPIIAECFTLDCANYTGYVYADSLIDLADTLDAVIAADGSLIIASHNSTDGDLNIVHCSDITCFLSGLETNFSNTDNTGVYPSMVLGADGLPIIVHRNETDTDIMITKCVDIKCANSSGEVIGGGATLGSVAGAWKSIYFDTLNLGQENANLVLDSLGNFKVNSLIVNADGNVRIGDVSVFNALLGAKMAIGSTDSSTTGDTQVGQMIEVGDVGVVSSGTDSTFGQYISVSRSGATGGTIATTGQILTVTGTGDNAAATVDNTGLNISVSGDTLGTTTNIGLAVDVNGADTNYAALFLGGSVGIGNATPTRTLDVAGTWGGNVVTSGQTDGGLGTLTTISTGALGYYLSQTNTDATSDIRTFNITGLSNTEGSHAYIVTKCVDSAGTGSCTLIVQINGTQVSTSTENVNGTTQTENYTIAYMNGAWRIVGLNSGVAQAADGADGADLAENFAAAPGEALTPGELVSFGGLAPNGESAAVRSTGAYDSKLFGIVSTQPGITLDDGQSYEKVAIALAGRVPALVSEENGPIAIGDPITASSVPGVGMKATEAGQIVGYAMQASVGGQSIIVVKLAPGFWAPSVSNILEAQTANLGSLQITGTANIASLNVSGTATVNNLSVTGNATIQGTLIVTGNVEIANLYVGGQLISKGAVPAIVPGAALGNVLGATTGVTGTSTAGTITITIGANIPVGGELAEITFANPYSHAPKIVISGNNKKSAKLGAYIIRTNTGFKIVSDDPLEPNATYEFDYIVVGAEN